MIFDEIFKEYLLIDYVKNVDLKTLAKNIKIARKSHKGVSVSNLGGWQSQAITPPDIISKDNNLISIFKQIQKNVDIIATKVNLKDKVYLKNFWFNINNRFESNAVHHHLHFMSKNIISGVFYVDYPKDSGEIVFCNSNDVRGALYDFSTITKYNEYNSQSWKVKPDTGKYLLFPSYLKHYVEPSKINKDRISIAFNFGYL
jgi:uncharacterized protein (TIGR02466 family)